MGHEVDRASLDDVGREDVGPKGGAEEQEAELKVFASLVRGASYQHRRNR